MNVSGHTLVFGLIGHPVRHSLSPAMHTRLFQHFGVDAVYVAFDVHPARSRQVADAMRTLDLRGANLTVPFKAAILDQLDRVTGAAEEARAVNVVIQHDGFLTGYNTDGEGFARALELRHGPLPQACSVLVLGSGGAGRAVAAAIAERGASRITFLNRTQDHARDSVDHLARFHPDTVFDHAPLTPAAFRAHVSGTALVANCTAGPARRMVEALPAMELDPATIWSDINYWMQDPPHLARLAADGRPVQGGLGMLLHQGALSFELFTGYPVEAELLQRVRKAAAES